MARARTDGGRGEIQRMDSGGRANRNWSTGCEGEFGVTPRERGGGRNCQETLGRGAQDDRLFRRLLISTSEALRLRRMWTAMSRCWAKGRNLDVREEILEEDMDLGAAYPSMVLEL